MASILPAASAALSPVSVYPDGASLLAVAPSRLEEQVILHTGLDMLGWHVSTAAVQ